MTAWPSAESSFTDVTKVVLEIETLRVAEKEADAALRERVQVKTGPGRGGRPTVCGHEQANETIAKTYYIYTNVCLVLLTCVIGAGESGHTYARAAKNKK